MKFKFYVLRPINALLTFILSVGIYFAWHNYQPNFKAPDHMASPPVLASAPSVTEPEQSISEDETPQQTRTLQSMSPAQAESVIAHRAADVILALKTKNMRRLAALVHPDQGIRFSQYECVLKGKNVVFKPKDLKTLWSSNKRYLWGGYDGTGDDIRSTFRSYYREFVYDRDFARAEHISFNNDLENSAQTLEDEYRHPISVKYYVPDPEGMEWRSLWLIFEKKNRVWYLAGIIHGQWTI